MRRRRRRFAAVALLAFVLVTSATAARNPSAPRWQRVPQASTPPTIIGTPTVGAIVTASVGSWSGPSRSYAFQWYHCDSAGNYCNQIANATQQQYVPMQPDLGLTLRVAVTATNRNGTGVSISAPSSVVTAAQPTPASTTTPTSTWTSTTTP